MGLEVFTDIGWMILNVVIVLLLSPLLEGIVRKVAARIQGRMGPPITQPYRDLKKLFSRSIITSPITCSDAIYRYSPLVVLALILCAAGLVPTIVSRPLALCNFIVALYVLALARFVLSIAALNVPNPFAAIGTSREHILSLGVEPTALLAAGIVLASIGSDSIGVASASIYKAITFYGPSYVLAATAFFMVMIADLALPPFDIAEAEQEIYEGILSEYGGPHLALLKLAISCKRLTMMNLFIAIFIPYGIATSVSWWIGPSIAIYLAKILTLTLITATISSCAARMKVLDIPKYLLIALSMSILAGIVYVVRP